MDAEASFIDGDVGPCPGHQVALADDRACPLDQRNDDVKGARRKLYRDAIPFEPSMRGMQAKRPKHEDFLGSRSRTGRGIATLQEGVHFGCRPHSRSLRPNDRERSGIPDASTRPYPGKGSLALDVE